MHRLVLGLQLGFLAMNTRRSYYAAIPYDRIVISFLFFLLFTSFVEASAQERATTIPCDSTIFEARSLRDDGRLGLVVLLNPSKPHENIDSIAVNVPPGESGFYSVSAEVEYNSGNDQINETFFLLVTLPNGRKSYPVYANLPRRSTAMLDANGDSIQYNIVLDDGLPDSHKTHRQIGVFFFEEGRNVVELHHYSTIDDLFPQFVNCPDTATQEPNCTVNSDGNNVIAGTQSVRIDSLVLTEFCADLGITQTAITRHKIFVDNDSAQAEIAGQDFEYILSVKNVGQNPAAQFVVSDTLPIILTPTFKNLTPTETTIDGPNQILSWVFDTAADSLFPGDSVDISFSVNIPEFLSPLPTPLFSGSRVETDEDPVDENNTSSTLVYAIDDPALRFADLAVSQLIAADSIITGDMTWVRLSVENFGPGPALNVTLTDTLPAILEALSPLPDFGAGGRSAVHGNVLFWQFDTLESGIVLQDSFLVKADSVAEAQTFVNPAFIQADNDTILNNNFAIDSLVVLPPPPPNYDLAHFQTATTDSVRSGEFFSYFLRLENLGPDTAFNILLQDSLPANISIRQPLPDFGIGVSAISEENLMTWQIEFLGPNDVLADTLFAVADTVADFTQAINKSVSTASFDRDSLNNNAETVITIAPPPPPPVNYDIVHTQEASRDTVFENESFTYFLRVENLGPLPAFSVTLRDSLPQNITLADSLTLPDFGIGVEPVLEQNILTWRFDALAAGSALVDSFSVIVDSLDQQVELVGLSSVTAANDTVLTNNVSQTTVIARPMPTANYDVVQLHSVSRDTVKSGEIFAYTLIVGNLGPATAYDVVLQDFLPDNVFPFGKLPNFSDNGQMTQQGQSLFWRFDSIAVNKAFADTLNVIVGQVFSPTRLSNVTIIQAENDTVSSNNSTQTTVFALPLAPIPTVNYDVSHSQTASKDTARSHEEIGYTLTLQNSGPATAFNVELQDSLPSGLSISRNLPDFSGAATVTQNGQNIFWTFDSIASQEVLTDSIFVSTGDISDATVFTNFSFTRATNDTVATNNDALTSFVALPPDPIRPAEYTLIHTQRVSADSVATNDVFNYTLTVENLGPDSSLAITMSDSLPSQITTTGAVPLLSRRENATLIWNLPAIAPNDSTVVTFSVQVAELPADQITPIANLSEIVDRGDTLSAQTTVVGVGETTPTIFSTECFLDRNVFAPETEQTFGINFSIDQPMNVRIDVHDMTGSHVIQLLDQNFGAGQNRFEWNGLDKNNRPAGSGLYIVTFRTDAFMDWKKFMIVR